MTVEEIELRKILKTMLAEAGITRDTLREIVNNIVEKKIKEVTTDILTKKISSWDFVNMIYNTHKYEFNSMIKNAINDNIKNVMVTTNIVIPKGSNVNLDRKD